ncbi:hypothetical protein [Pseudomonas siliginis]|uniref:hypothetical protein n=1 Tax=Pseudomonas siliginis TaxID=2842346 RepID=UPI002092295D|nr:hypothetical protein [Pseudomonas siliginis]UST77261.1 hypothetical protein NF676_00330 [Pseudomonas siliginis]
MAVSSNGLVTHMLRNYTVLYVNMSATIRRPEEFTLSIQVADLSEEQIENTLLDKARNVLSEKLSTSQRQIAIHGFTLISTA